MRGRGLPCGELGELARAAEPGPGGSAGYTLYHVLAALREASERPVGRPYLERALGLSEASARSLIRRLRSMGLLEPAGKAGHRATERGSRLASLHTLVLETRAAGIPGIPWRPVAVLATLAIDPPRSLVDVYRVRDYLVGEGCRETVIGGVESGSLRLPGIPEDQSQLRLELWRIVEEQLQRPQGSPGLLLVVVPEHCRAQAYTALLKALLDLCRDPARARPSSREGY